jgi:N-acetylmuramoyl-L-alanine amidase
VQSLQDLYGPGGAFFYRPCGTRKIFLAVPGTYVPGYSLRHTGWCACDSYMTANHKPRRCTFQWRNVFLVCALCTLLVAQPEPKQLTIYAPQTSYSVTVVERGGVEYTDLVATLEPLGAVSTKVSGKKLKISFNKSQGEFEQDKTRAKLAGKSVELAAPLRVENHRGLVPLASVPQVVASLAGMTPDYHAAARRLFLNGAGTHYSLEAKKDPSRLVFTFTAPVNPMIATEAGRLRMNFGHEPVVGSPTVNLEEPGSPAGATRSPGWKQVSFAEQNGAAQIEVSTSTPLIASFSDGGRTITLAPVAPPTPAPNLAKTPAPIPGIGEPSTATAPAARPRYAVVIDPAHGGDDTGATVATGIFEKEITLALARRLRQELENRGIAALVLRNSDTSIAPEQRASIANASGAGLYIALHASSSGSGVRVFTFPFTEAGPRPVAFIPWDEAQMRHVQASKTAASAFATEFLKEDIPSRSVAAPVRPLNNIAVSAVAIEMAPPPQATAEALQSPEYQKTVATAMAIAIANLHPEAH